MHVLCTAILITDNIQHNDMNNNCKFGTHFPARFVPIILKSYVSVNDETKGGGAITLDTKFTQPLTAILANSQQDGGVIFRELEGTFHNWSSSWCCSMCS